MERYMEMYDFKTEWFFEAPLERVWDEAKNIDSYPAWWRGLEKVEIRGVDHELRLGTVADCEVKGFLPFRLRFAIEVTRYDPPSIMELKSSGALVGQGKWVLEPVPGGTASVFFWNVGTSNVLFNLFAKLPFAKTLLKKSHDHVMAQGYRAVKARIEE